MILFIIKACVLFVNAVGRNHKYQQPHALSTKPLSWAISFSDMNQIRYTHSFKRFLMMPLFLIRVHYQFLIICFLYTLGSRIFVHTHESAHPLSLVYTKQLVSATFLQLFYNLLPDSSCAEVASWKLLGVCPALALIFEILRFKFIVKRCSNQSHIHPTLHNLDFNLKAHGWICEIYERDRERGGRRKRQGNKDGKEGMNETRVCGGGVTGRHSYI